MAALLEVRNLAVTYGRVEAVRDVSLAVDAGEYVSIIGNNGAGKSSTLKAIAGVVRPAGGEIILDGKPIAGKPSYDIVRLGLSMVPEGRLIFADQTVEDNLYLGAYSRRGGGRSREVSEDLERMFALFPILKNRRQQLAGSLSGGEQQMLALSRGLLSRPRLLMIDEMSLGLGAAGSGNIVPGYRNAQPGRLGDPARRTISDGGPALCAPQLCHGGFESSSQWTVPGTGQRRASHRVLTWDGERCVEKRMRTASHTVPAPHGMRGAQTSEVKEERPCLKSLT